MKPNVQVVLEGAEALAGGDGAKAVAMALGAFLLLCYKRGLSSDAILFLVETMMKDESESQAYLKAHYEAEGRKG